MKQPAVSLITVVHNSAATIRDCMESVLEQTYPDIEYIVIDGGSNDGTVEIIESHKARIARFISGPDQGMYDAMNKGIALASGDIIGFLNADDIYADEHVLKRVIQVFDDPTVDACYGDLVYVARDNRDKVMRYWKAGAYRPRSLYHGWMPPHPTFFVRRSVYELCGKFNLSLGTSADYELMLRVL